MDLNVHTLKRTKKRYLEGYQIAKLWLLLEIFLVSISYLKIDWVGFQKKY